MALLPDLFGLEGIGQDGTVRMPLQAILSLFDRHHLEATPPHAHEAIAHLYVSAN